MRDVVGRDALLADLVGWLAPAATGSGRSVLLRGEPGIGKSVLVEAVTDALTGAPAGRFRAARGWCSAAGAAPYWPWRRILATVAPGLEFAADDRDALVVAVIDALEAAARQTPLLLIVEDVHWADPSSLRLLRSVADAVPALPVALVLTARDDPLDVTEAVRSVLAGLPVGVRRVVVPPLDAPAVSALVERVAGVLPPEVVADVTARTGGNPFFATEVARLLMAHGPGGAAVVPPGVREVLERRLARLSQAGQSLLTAAAVAGETAPAAAGRDPVDEQLLGAVCGLDPATLADLLDEVVAARLVEAGRAGPRFAHALIREVLTTGMSNAERGRLHRRVAEALDATGGPAERLAHHWARAGGPDTDGPAGRWALRAADEAMAGLGFEQAAAHLRRALAIRGVDRVDALVRLGAAQRLAGDVSAARTAFRTAADLAEAAGRADDLAAAALGLGGGVAGFEVPIGDAEQVALLRRAEAALPADDGAPRAAVLARLSVALTGFGPPSDRVRVAERAVAMAERCGDDAVTAAALAAYCDAVAGPDHVEARRSGAERMLTVAGDRVAQLLARRLRLVAELERGDFAAVDLGIDAYQRIADETGVALYRWLPEIWWGMRALLRGDVEAAFNHATAAEAIGARAGSGNAAILVFTLRMSAHLTAGTADRYVATTRELLAEVDTLPLPLTYWAGPTMLLVAAGDGAAGRALLRRFADTPAPDIAPDSEWLEGHWALADLAVTLGDRVAGARLLHTLRPYERLWAVDGIGGAVFGTVGHQLGRLAAGQGRLREAAGYLRTALRDYTEAGTPLLAERTRSDLDRLGAPAASTDSTPAPDARIHRAGRFWQLTWARRTTTVADGKGVRDLAVLLTRPGTPVAAVDLVEAAGGPATAATGGDLGPALDVTARRAYRERVVDLDAEIGAAEDDADLARAERLRAERAMLIDELSHAFGLGGRSRPIGDPAEKARKAVTMRIRDAVRRIEAGDPALGRHLRNAVKTGRMCVYEPDTEVHWRT